MPNSSSPPRAYSQRCLSKYSVFLIPWNTSANKSSRAKVFHIMKVESKSISYHAFGLCFLLVSVLTTGQGEREQSASTWYQFLSRTKCLKLLPDCLPSLALKYSSSTVEVLQEKMPHLHGEQVRQVKVIPRSMWRQRANSSSTNDEDHLPCLCRNFHSNFREKMPHHVWRADMWKQRAQDHPAQFKIKAVESYFFKSKSTSYQQSRGQNYLMACFSFTPALICRTRRKKAIWSALGEIEQRNRPKPLPRACLPYRRNKQRRMQHVQDQSCGKSTSTTTARAGSSATSSEAKLPKITCHVKFLVVQSFKIKPQQALEEITSRIQDQVSTTLGSNPSRSSHQRPLKKLQDRFEIKCPTPLNQILQDQASMALEEITSPVQDQVSTTLESTFKIKPQRHLKKFAAQKSRFRPQRPLKKSQARFKIKCPPPLNQPSRSSLNRPLKKFPVHLKNKPRRPLDRHLH